MRLFIQSANGVVLSCPQALAATRTPVRLAARADLIIRMICLLSLRRLENAAPWCSEQDSTRRAFQFVESFTRLAWVVFSGRETYAFHRLDRAGARSRFEG
jgi:hypothetical protein